MEKRRVRETADRATAALGELERKVKARWSEELEKAAGNGSMRRLDQELNSALQELKQAEEVAEALRPDAKAT